MADHKDDMAKFITFDEQTSKLLSYPGSDLLPGWVLIIRDGIGRRGLLAGEIRHRVPMGSTKLRQDQRILLPHGPEVDLVAAFIEHLRGLGYQVG